MMKLNPIGTQIRRTPVYLSTTLALLLLGCVDNPNNGDPGIVDFVVYSNLAGYWTISGTVEDEFPENCSVHITGLYTGELSVESDGSFLHTFQTTSPGYVQAIAEDPCEALSDEVEDYVDNG